MASSSILYTVAALSLAMQSVTAAQMVEPNDTLETATVIDQMGSGGTTVTPGMLGDGEFAERDVDIFSFSVEGSEAPFLLDAKVIAVDLELDAMLRVFDSAGLELANNDDGTLGSTNPQLALLLLEPGTYFVGVGTSANPHYDSSEPGSGRPGTGGAFALRLITESATLPSSSMEPNDDVTRTTSMGSESFTVAGEWIGDGAHGRLDVDVYELELIGAARIDVEVVPAAGSPLDPVVRVRNCTDPIGQFTWVDPCLMGMSDNRADGSVDAITAVGVTMPQVIYIMVSGGGNRRYNPAVSGSGEPGSVGGYELNVTVTYFNPIGPREPDDSISMATRLHPFVVGRPDTIEIDGYLGDGRFSELQGDRDFFEVTLVDESQFLTVDVAAESIGSDLDPVVVVYDFEGHIMARHDSVGVSRDVQLVLPVGCVPVEEDAVSAYVMVTGARQRLPLDPFRPVVDHDLVDDGLVDDTIVDPLALTDGPGSTGPYRLTLSVSEISTSCGNEPDDTLATATDTGIVGEGTYVCTGGVLGDSLCLDPTRDADFWSVEVTSPMAVLEVDAWNCPADYDTGQDIYVFDAQAQLLAAEQIRWDSAPQLRVHLSSPGIYFVAFTYNDQMPFDPTIPCSASSWPGAYEIVIRLTPGPGSVSSGGVASTAEGEESTLPLFATQLDGTGFVDVIDPGTGDVVRSFAASQRPFGGSEGIAFDGTNLHFFGAGRYPILYTLDPYFGTVLDQYILWVGSGYYSDAVMLGHELYVLDYRDRAIHVIDPANRQLVRTLPVGMLNHISISGGLGALAGPRRLYVADAFNTGAVYEVERHTGQVTNSFVPQGIRPTALGGMGDAHLYIGDWESPTITVVDRTGTSVDSLTLSSNISSLSGQAFVPFPADADGDGDIDLFDFGQVQRCFTGTGGGVVQGCEQLDRDGNGHIGLADFSGFPTAMTGP